jgi:tRNA (cytidine/uridine-2'-O-)-methyltransferase
MFEVVLFEPEIPPNTGNVIRLCVNVGARLHLVEPLGFDISERALRRAGLDYAERMSLNVHPNFDALKTALPTARIWAFTTHAKRMLPEANLAAGDVLLFGPESRGLPPAIRESLPQEQWLRIPMRADSRSLNLSNAVAVAVYEGLRQHQYAGLA